MATPGIWAGPDACIRLGAWDTTARGRWTTPGTWVRSHESWVPPVEEELVVAARASELSRWYPFTSHNYLRFAADPDFWVSAEAAAGILPGAISFEKGGPDDNPAFRVWSGQLLGTPDPVLELVTPDADAAVAALVRLLAAESRPK